MKRYSVWIALLVSLILQATVVPYMSVGWIRPDFPVIVLLFIGVRKGPIQAILAAFLTGLLADVLGGRFLGVSSFSYTFAAFFTAKIFYYDVPLPLRRWAAATGTGIMLHAIISSFIYTLDAQPAFLTLLWKHALPFAAYTWLVAMLWALSPFYERREGLKL